MSTVSQKAHGNGWQDLTGRTFGKLHVDSYDCPVEGKKDHWWICTCSCGNPETKRAKGTLLRNGKAMSCGCLYRETRGKAQTTHGLSGTPEHVIWSGIKGRCYSPRNTLFPKYGAKGVKVCERWRKSFVAFLEDVGPRPSPELSVDRIKGELHYSCGKHDECDECRANGWPANHRWTTGEVQSNNRDFVKKYDYLGEGLSLAQIARKTGINYLTLRKWVIYEGMTLEAAVARGRALQLARGQSPVT